MIITPNSSRVLPRSKICDEAAGSWQHPSIEIGVGVAKRKGEGNFQIHIWGTIVTWNIRRAASFYPRNRYLSIDSLDLTAANGNYAWKYHWGTSTGDCRSVRVNTSHVSLNVKLIYKTKAFRRPCGSGICLLRQLHNWLEISKDIGDHKLLASNTRVTDSPF